jgi:DNA mismatch endonuclease (patch repair protein)
MIANRSPFTVTGAISGNFGFAIAHGAKMPVMPEGLQPPTPSKRRAMQNQRERDTFPELALRRALHRRGFRYKVDATLPLPGVRRRCDLMFSGPRVAVFLDSCFWHVCPEHATWPKSNSEWWHDKLTRNVERDRQTDALLRGAGWQSVRVWEHEDPEEGADRVAATLRDRSPKI